MPHNLLTAIIVIAVHFVLCSHSSLVTDIYSLYCRYAMHTPDNSIISARSKSDQSPTYTKRRIAETITETHDSQTR